MLLCFCVHLKLWFSNIPHRSDSAQILHVQLNILPEYFVVQLADIKVDTVTCKQIKVVGGATKQIQLQFLSRTDSMNIRETEADV